MRARLHGLVGVVALLCIGAFWFSTIVSELFMGTSSVVAVKQGILRAMWILIPAMVATGASGFALGRGRAGPLVGRKIRRMRVIAANGLLVLNFRDGLRLAGRVGAS